MNKIVNWTFGSVFRTIGRFIGYFLLVVLLGFFFSKSGLKLPDFLVRIIGINYVKATTTDRWALNLPNVVDGRWYDCNGATSCNTQMSTATVSINSRSYIAGDDIGVIASNGMLLQYYSPSNFKTGYLYNVGLYMCSTKNLSDVDFEVYSNLSGSRGTNNNIYSSSARTTLSNEPFAIGSEVGSYCYLYQGQFVPATDTSWVQLRLKKSSGSITNFTPALISITVEGVGPYETIIKNAVRSAISQSGLATTSDINNMSDDITSAQQDTTNAVNDLNDSITDDSVSGASSSAGSFFTNFNNTTHGLTGIISAPLNAINSLTSATCSPLVLPLPFVNQNLTLPCMRTIYTSNFGAFMNIYDIVVLGIVSYWILVRIFALVKDFKNPEHDEIEVMDL